jgi:hypothetical protein
MAVAQQNGHALSRHRRRLSDELRTAEEPNLIITEVEVQLKEKPAQPGFRWREGLPGSEPTSIGGSRGSTPTRVSLGTHSAMPALVVRGADARVQHHLLKWLAEKVRVPLLVAETSDGGHMNIGDFLASGSAALVRTSSPLKGGVTGAMTDCAFGRRVPRPSRG